MYPIDYKNLGVSGSDFQSEYDLLQFHVNQLNNLLIIYFLKHILTCSFIGDSMIIKVLHFLYYLKRLYLSPLFKYAETFLI